MELDDLVRAAAGGDVHAFVALTRRFQQAAFGSALSLTRDFQQAEDVVQEALVAAWSSLPSLAEPKAFPGWLRGIVRHHACRLLRRRHLEAVPLANAADLPSDEPGAERQLEAREEATAALAAIGALPASPREPATLFYLHECSQQDVATFLGLTVTAVNNRLHQARQQLKRRMPTMVESMLGAHALPDDFANRIGRLAASRGQLIEALFDPNALPDILTELAISDEARRRGITAHVVQRPGGGVVRAIALAPADVPVGELQRGATVLSSSRWTKAPLASIGLDRVVPLLAGKAAGGTLLETGIKVIDVLCPLVAGGSLAIAGEYRSGTTVVLEEIVRRLGGGSEPLSIFAMIPPPSEQWWPEPLKGNYSLAAALKQDGCSEGTVGAVQTFFFIGDEDPWTPAGLSQLDPVDVVIHLSRDLGIGRHIYPTVHPFNSRSRWLENDAVSAEHRAIAVRVRDALAAWLVSDDQPTPLDRLQERGRKLARFMAQPFFVAEPYTKRPGLFVSRADALAGCREILDGEHDDLPTRAFYFDGSTADIRRKAATTA
jgi:RNA polymerase sigma factor (sigma-70 family)